MDAEARGPEDTAEKEASEGASDGGNDGANDGANDDRNDGGNDGGSEGASDGGNDRGDGTEDEARARGRALSSPLRIRILRYCLHEPRTNREIAARFELNPATSLHHVRTLTDTGFLRADPVRRGARGAREIPYRATRLSWRTPLPHGAMLLVNAFLADLEGVDPADIEASRLGVKLNDEHRRQLIDRITGVLGEYAAMPDDDDGEPTSIFFAHHPDLTARDR